MSDLQFDTAEPQEGESVGVACAVCSSGIVDTYYEAGGQVVCSSCRDATRLAGESGGGAGRFFRALVFGTGAGAAGAGVYYGILAMTGYEVGLISILVGVMVGVAVKTGAQAKGGWVYQLLAVALTYTSIVTAYVPMVYKQLSSSPEAPAEVSDSATPPPGAAPAPTEVPAADEAPAPEPIDDNTPMSGGLLLIFAVAVAYFYPALLLMDQGAGALLSIGIIAFGLWEAWKINRKVNTEFTGPYSLSETQASA